MGRGWVCGEEPNRGPTRRVRRLKCSEQATKLAIDGAHVGVVAEHIRVRGGATAHPPLPPG